jgi:membrane associated rhomboid family serine protease
MASYRISTRKRSIFGSLSVTTIIILITVMAYILFAILLNAELIPLDLIAIKPTNILHGAYLLSFITSMFMHGGFFHLFANMLSLLFIGSLVEKILGQRRYFLFYMLAGLFAGLFFVLSTLVFPGDLNTYAVGASGALFGLVGLLVVLTPNLPVYIMFIPIPVKMKYAAPGILILLWLISIAGNVPIGNTAHLGGLLAGLAYGIYLRKKYRRKTRYLDRVFR